MIFCAFLRSVIAQSSQMSHKVSQRVLYY